MLMSAWKDALDKVNSVSHFAANMHQKCHRAVLARQRFKTVGQGVPAGREN